jgi:hypothetical protein
MKNSLKVALVCFLAASLNFLGLAQAAQAALIATHELAASANDGEDRSLVLSTLQRQDLREKFAELGLDPADIEQRVAALSEEEVSRLAEQIRSAPAGGDISILGFILVIFLVLLITDILGYTKIFPFTKPVK